MHKPHRFLFVFAFTVLVSACATSESPDSTYKDLTAVDYHDARGSRLDAVALETSQDARYLVGRVIAEGGQNPRHPVVEARYFDATGALVLTTQSRLEKDLGRRVVLRQRQGHFRIAAPEHFDRVELKLLPASL